MRDPVSAMLDGLTVAGNHGVLLAGILALAAVSQFILYSVLRRIFENKLTAGEYYSLSLGGWLLPASLISIFWYISAAVVSLQSAALITAFMVILAGILLSVRSPRGKMVAATSMIPALLLITGLFIILRLAYVSRAILPMYFD
jgi:hypothetical protein